MRVLGLDTSTGATAVALQLSDGSSRELRDDPPAGAHPGHATRLLAMAEQLLAGRGLGWRAIDRIAVGLGPGTFTGLRVGVATARGLAQSLGIEIVGVSSLAALAGPALRAAAGGRCGAGTPGAAPGVLAVIDARRGEAFAAAYELACGGGPVGLTAPAALAPAALAEPIEEVDRDGAARDWIAVGDGALRYRAELERVGARVPRADEELHRVSAASVCALGARAPVPGGGLAAILPDYRRRPDAELALEGAPSRAPSPSRDEPVPGKDSPLRGKDRQTGAEGARQR